MTVHSDGWITTWSCEGSYEILDIIKNNLFIENFYDKSGDAWDIKSIKDIIKKTSESQGKNGTFRSCKINELVGESKPEHLQIPLDVTIYTELNIYSVYYAPDSIRVEFFVEIGGHPYQEKMSDLVRILQNNLNKISSLLDYVWISVVFYTYYQDFLEEFKEFENLDVSEYPDQAALVIKKDEKGKLEVRCFDMGGVEFTHPVEMMLAPEGNVSLTKKLEGCSDCKTSKSKLRKITAKLKNGTSKELFECTRCGAHIRIEE